MHNKSFINARVAPFMFLVLVALNSNLYGQKGLEAEKGHIVGEREKCRARVEFIHKFSRPTSTKYAKGMLLYEDLRGAVQDWTTSISSAIESDDLKNFQKSPAFKEKSTRVALAEKKFISYVDSLINSDQDSQETSAGQRLFGIAPTGETTTKTPSISDWVKTGKDILDGIGKAKDIFRKDPEREKKWLEFRRQQAKNFADDTAWLTWKEIVAAL